MKTKPTKTLFLALALSAAGPAQPALCQLDDVKVTGVGIFDGTTAGAALIPIPLNTLPVGAAACAGAFQGNDGFYPNTNLGYAGDGLLNGGPQVASRSILFPGGAFIGEQYPLQDLRGDGTADDPGWIMLGKSETQVAALSSVTIRPISALPSCSKSLIFKEALFKGRPLWPRQP